MNLEFGTIQGAEAGGHQNRSRWQPSRAQLRRRLHLCLIFLDALCILSGFFIAGLVYQPSGTTGQWLVATSVFIPIYLLVALNSHAYASRVIQAPGRGVLLAIRSFAIALGVVLLAGFYLKTSEQFSRGTIGIGAGASTVLLALGRDLFLRKARKILGGNPYNVALITDGTQGVGTDGFSLIIASDDSIEAASDSPAMYDRLAAALEHVDRVVVACAPEQRLGWVRILKGVGIQSEILAPELVELAPLRMDIWRASPTLVIADGALSQFDSGIKRVFDLVIAGVSLVLLAPVLFLTALVIKLESRGPVFFVQTRIGLGNRMFKMLKFRSMRAEKSDGQGNTSTQRDDDRITRVGAFIRRTSIDELPQLINILLGDMSIVGPRPHALGSKAEDKLFWEIDERYWHRHAAKPGLTGLAQVRGFRGATMREQDLTDRLQADLEYLNDWSIWKDIQILLLTFRVLVHKNAY